MVYTFQATTFFQSGVHIPLHHLTNEVKQGQNVSHVVSYAMQFLISMATVL